MGAQHADERNRRDGTGTTMKRRGILHAAGTAVGVALAGIVAKQTSVRVAATTTDTNFVANGTATYGFDTFQGTFATGVYGRGTNTGVIGTGGPYGVFGTGGIIGVFGQTVGTNANTIAVQAINGSSGAGGIGVLGQSDATGSNIGVLGISNLGTGVSGASNGNAGVLGTTTKSGFSGLAGIVSTPGTAAFAGTATVPTAFAGFFTGDVYVNGNFTVNDPTRKHGAIQHPDGSLRLLYSMESPESWLEDFGTGQLVGGHATVTLDPDFAAIAETGDYSVFLTPEGDCNGLYVTAKSAASFAVRELQAGSATLAFRYRVVAKPKSEHKATRLAKFVIPEIKVPQPPPLPEVVTAVVPTPPPPPVPPQALPPARSSAPSGGPPAAPQGSGTTPATTPVQPAPPPRP